MTRFSKLFCAAMLFGSHLFAADPADFVIHAKYVVTMDTGHNVIEDGAVAIRGARIAAVGTRAQIDAAYHAAYVLDKPDALIAPGLIDTHTHAPMSLFRAIADDKRLEDWLQNYIFPAEAKVVTPEFVRWGTRLACLEMVLAGITTYTDMYYFEDVEAEAAKQAGVRGVLGQTVIGFPAPDHKTWQGSIEATEQFIQKFKDDELITPAVAPHAIYTTPDEALVAAHNLALKYKIPLAIHLSETKKERDDSLAKRKMTPTQVLEKLGVFDSHPVIAAHSIWESDDDLKILKKHNVGVAYCPSSNMKLADGVARVPEMLKLGISTAFGTDGFAGSNDNADLILEMNIGSKLQKITSMNPTTLPAEQAFDMATMGGARVLGMEKEIGSLEAGKRADLIVVSLAGPNAVPLYNVYSQLVYASKAADVQEVFINGKHIVEDRHVLTLNKDEIYAKALEFQKQVLEAVKH